MKYLTWIPLCCALMNAATVQDVTIDIDASKDRRAVSPYIYGRNNTFDRDPSFYKDAGLRFVRMNGGNNATKYNWRKKITSHPDWYNNVYGADWDAVSEQISANYIVEHTVCIISSDRSS